MGGALAFALVAVAVHALGTALGGWAFLDENYSKQEHGQDLIAPMGVAWFTALFCWAPAGLQIACVVLVRNRRPWTRVALAVPMVFVAVSTAFTFLLSLTTGTPAMAAFVIFAVDVAALWALFGENGRRWFSVRGTEPASPRGGDLS